MVNHEYLDRATYRIVVSSQTSQSLNHFVMASSGGDSVIYQVCFELSFLYKNAPITSKNSWFPSRDKSPGFTPGPLSGWGSFWNEKLACWEY